MEEGEWDKCFQYVSFSPVSGEVGMRREEQGAAPCCQTTVFVLQDNCQMSK